MTGKLPSEIKKQMGVKNSTPSQDIMDEVSLLCEHDMHVAIATALGKAIRDSRRNAKKNGQQWLGMDWDDIVDIIIEQSFVVVSNHFGNPIKVIDHFGKDKGMTLIEARKNMRNYETKFIGQEK